MKSIFLIVIGLVSYQKLISQEFHDELTSLNVFSSVYAGLDKHSDIYASPGSYRNDIGIDIGAVLYKRAGANKIGLYTSLNYSARDYSVRVGSIFGSSFGTPSFLDRGQVIYKELNINLGVEYNLQVSYKKLKPYLKVASYFGYSISDYLDQNILRLDLSRKSNPTRGELYDVIGSMEIIYEDFKPQKKFSRNFEFGFGLCVGKTNLEVGISTYSKEPATPRLYENGSSFVYFRCTKQIFSKADKHLSS